MGPTSEKDPPMTPTGSHVRDDGIQHRKRGEPFVRECDQHDVPTATWDSKTKVTETSRIDEKQKKGGGVLEVLKGFVKKEKEVKVEDVLASQDSQ